MKLSELAKSVGLSVSDQDGCDALVTGLALDSRKVQSGFLFAALAGTQVHGREFIQMAISNGAVAILSDQMMMDCQIPVLVATDPARKLAQMASIIYPDSPQNIIAVTGTNGKSSTVEFLRQIWQNTGRKAACLGTLGLTTDAGVIPSGYTTPDCIALHQNLSELAKQGVTDCAIEASSHGLDQRRMDAVVLSAAGFSNLTQDHFDYHNDFTDYFSAKQRLFLELLPDNFPVAINVDDQYGAKLADICQQKGLMVWRVGWSGVEVKLLEIQPMTHGQKLHLRVMGDEHTTILPLVGEFQASNALLALALSIQTGTAIVQALSALEKLIGVRGRLELAGMSRSQVPVLVDFAHSPDGLKKLLQSVRPHTKERVILVFGCGGDRDSKKRSLMGQIASEFADVVIVTDDNPRTENPQKIRTAILATAPDAVEIADREQAIAYAIERSMKDDLIVIAGKGHEQGQIVGNQVFEFDDVRVAKQLLEKAK
ncbi:MAG: UDP-N-acetylmuramoyl-L-alanyl-D-glutamate--2,6-diaminopimelate ligase [Robiginitomaculum sp.]|nr:UDP-N-acetylmuramoyl-L-alanyl-D-glutamate--2,6-diaminopimelate ligase [Robiginitomaculum sp.]